MKSTEWKNHTLLAASFAIVLMAVGCGRQESQSAGASSTEKGATRVAASQTGGPREEVGGGVALTSADGDAPREGGLQGESEGSDSSIPEGSAASQAVSEPPDVVASISDSLAAPGPVVTVIATGSPDVVAMTLSDGLGRPKSLTYDATSKVWKTSYRVPLKAATARLGFSITATNAHQQWRRVWVFPKLEGDEVAREQDSE